MSAIKKYFKNEFSWRMLMLEHPTPSDFYLSVWQRNRSATPLLIVRLILFLGILGIVIASMVYYTQISVLSYWFIYLTHWGLLSVLVTTALAFAVSAKVFFYGPISSGYNLPWYVKLYWVSYNAGISLAFLITTFYWTVLYGSGTEEEFNKGLDVSVHGLNSIVMLLLLVTSAQPSRLLHVIHPIILAFIYVSFGIIYYLAGGKDRNGNRWIYAVVDWSKPGLTLGVCAITGILLLVLHCVAVGLTKCRDALGKSSMGEEQPTEHEVISLRRPPADSDV